MTKITQQDLQELFSSQVTHQSDTAIQKKPSSTSSVVDVRKKLSKINSRKPSRVNWGQLFDDFLRFLSITGFAGFILFVVMGWSGISKQLEWGYFVNYLNNNMPSSSSTATATATANNIAVPAALPQLEEPSVSFSENRIKVERLNIDAPVIWDVEEENIIEKLKEGVVHYRGTASPGEGGNIFLVGHSSNYFWIKSEYNSIFALLDKLTPGDRIELARDKKKYTYEVKSSSIVKPDEVQVLEATPKETLSLMSCWPVGTTLKRIVVQSELLFAENIKN